MNDLSLRKNQILEGYTAIKPDDFKVTKMTVQEHTADKAGLHYDIRLDLDGKAISFASRKGFPDTPGKPRLLIRQPDHQTSYMNWEGTIPSGEYGAGAVKVFDSQDVVVSSEENKIRLLVPKGPNAGNYTLVNTKDKDWLLVKNKELDRYWDERPDYKKVKLDLESIPKDNFLVSRKYDGAHFIAKLTDKGISLTSQNKSISGENIAREDNYPHIKYTKVPKEFVGAVIRGELHHPKGFNTLSAMTLASPDKSWKMQEALGKAEFIPFELQEFQGKKFSDYSPEERAKLVDSIADALPNTYIKPPERKRPGESVRDFFNRVVAAGGEGIVLQDRVTGEFYKKKNRLDFDLRIKDITEGTGRLSGSAGALVLEDRSGTEVGNVGTGFSDEMRKDLFKNKSSYIGKLVKIKSDAPLKAKSIRGPSFVGFSVDKSIPDLL